MITRCEAMKFIRTRCFCRFPSWTEGRWELVTVQGNVFTYTDHTFFKNYTFQCLEEVDQRYSHYQPSADDKHILVHAKTQW